MTLARSRVVAAGVVMGALAAAAPALAGTSPGYPVYSAAVRLSAGDGGVRSTIRVPASFSDVGGSSYVAAWVRASKTPGPGNEWIEVGWIRGACGPGCTASTPTVFVAFRSGSATTTWLTFPSFGLSPNGAYRFMVENTSGNTWRAHIHYGGSWHVLRTQELTFGASANYSIQAIEYVAPQGAVLPSFGSDVDFTNTEIKQGGSWTEWSEGDPTTTAQDSNVTFGYMAYDRYYSAWRVSRTEPSFTQSASPSSLHVLPLSSGTSTITVVTNKTYDAHQNFQGPVTFSTQGAPPGVVASVSPQMLSPLANQTVSARLTITVLLPQLEPFTVSVRGCGRHGALCRTSSVTVRTLPL